MKYKQTLLHYDFEAGEFRKFESFLQERGFRISDRSPPGQIGMDTIIDNKVGESADRTCGAIIDYPWGLGNKGLHAVQGSRLEKVILQYQKTT